MRQMTIFDYLKTPGGLETNCDLDQLPEDEMVRIVGRAIGINFEFVGGVLGWVAHPKKKVELSISYDNYDLLDNTNRFIGVGIDDKNNHCGAGAPCDTIRHAIEFFERHR